MAGDPFGTGATLGLKHTGQAQPDLTLFVAEIAWTTTTPFSR